VDHRRRHAALPALRPHRRNHLADELSAQAPQDRVRLARSDAASTTGSPAHAQRQRRSGRRGERSILPARAMTAAAERYGMLSW
jgi:hypothetical protein